MGNNYLLLLAHKKKEQIFESDNPEFKFNLALNKL